MKKVIGFILVGLLVTGCVTRGRFRQAVATAQLAGIEAVNAEKTRAEEKLAEVVSEYNENIKKLSDRAKQDRRAKSVIESADAAIQAFLAQNCGCAHKDVLLKGKGGPAKRLKNFLALNCKCAHKKVLAGAIP